MELINGNWYLDDFDRVEHMVDIVVSMHESYGISLEEAAGHFDRYAQAAMRFVNGEMFTHRLCRIYSARRDQELMQHLADAIKRSKLE